jgi:hypothetical protein
MTQMTMSPPSDTGKGRTGKKDNRKGGAKKPASKDDLDMDMDKCNA